MPKENEESGKNGASQQEGGPGRPRPGAAEEMRGNGSEQDDAGEAKESSGEKGKKA